MQLRPNSMKESACQHDKPGDWRGKNYEHGVVQRQITKRMWRLAVITIKLCHHLPGFTLLDGSIKFYFKVILSNSEQQYREMINQCICYSSVVLCKSQVVGMATVVQYLHLVRYVSLVQIQHRQTPLSQEHLHLIHCSNSHLIVKYEVSTIGRNHE